MISITQTPGVAGKAAIPGKPKPGGKQGLGGCGESTTEDKHTGFPCWSRWDEHHGSLSKKFSTRGECDHKCWVYSCCPPERGGCNQGRS